MKYIQICMLLPPALSPMTKEMEYVDIKMKNEKCNVYCIQHVYHNIPQVPAVQVLYVFERWYQWYLTSKKSI
ncbi:hypothetical protein BDZ91DRAFT_709306, partial [Kalaharituber pfeilii]